MRIFGLVMFVILVAMLAISGVFGLLGIAFGLTFGIIGAVMSIIWRIVFNPFALILLIVLICTLSKRRRPAK